MADGAMIAARPRRGKPPSSPADSGGRPVYSVAPIAFTSAEGSFFAERDVPQAPPAPLPRVPEPPPCRLLKVYAFDPSLGRLPGNVITIAVPY